MRFRKNGRAAFFETGLMAGVFVNFPLIDAEFSLASLNNFIGLYKQKSRGKAKLSPLQHTDMLEACTKKNAIFAHDNHD